MKAIYLDNAATTPVMAEVLHAMVPYYTEACGNPSSIHKFGRDAREAVDDARGQVASLMGAKDSEVVFTSGGTEADNFAVKGVAHALAKKGRHIITSTIEHHAVINALKSLAPGGYEVTHIPVDSTGLVDPASIESAIRDDTILITVMHANNEVGTVEPIEEIGRIAQERDVCFHSDAVQSFGHIPTLVDNLGVDLLSCSGHKLHGPKGIGALYIREGTKIDPLIHGGNQERKRRASTENVPGIVGLGKAAEVASRDMEGREARVRKLRDGLARGILEAIDEAHLNGHPTRRLPGNVNLTVRYVEGESMVLGLDEMGVSASTGSACTSGDLSPSHVLLALGIPPEDIHSSIRLTVGSQNTSEDVDHAAGALIKVVERLRRMSPLYDSGP
jgi:cysteine desulfurase